MSPKIKKRLTDLSLIVGLAGILGMAASVSVLIGAIISWFVGGNPFLWGIAWFFLSVGASTFMIGADMKHDGNNDIPDLK